MTSRATAPETLIAGPRDGVMVPSEACGAIIIDLDFLGRNWQCLRDRVAPAECAAVVKADCYGLGASACVPALVNAGAKTLFVATVQEAREVRKLAPDAQVFVLDGVLPGSAPAFLECGALPVLSSLPEMIEWGQMAPSRNEPVGCALHVDSGLNRLGLSTAEIREFAANMHLLDRLDVKLVMSHLACADEPDHPKNQQQLSVFHGLQPLLPSVALSLAASDGLMLGPEFHFQLVRPGYALYGGQTHPNRNCPVSPVVSVYSRVLQVRELAPTQSVGYSATFVADRVTKLAVLAAGYADGVPRHLSAGTNELGGHVAINGRLAPIVGRVSMDLITVDITDLEDITVERGDWVELIGPTITLEDVGIAAGTIGYEILTRLSPRLTRVYVGGEQSGAGES
ncbi:MAG: alanine racemase [Filomicrobium sp.]